MTLTTVVRDTDSLLNLARLGDGAAWSELVDRCAAPVFDPSALAAAASSFPGLRALGQHRWSHPGMGNWNGRTVTLTLGPGLASLRVSEAVLEERAVERVRAETVRQADEAAAYLIQHGQHRPDRAPSRVIVEWSGKSRRRMLRAFVSVDWSALDVDGAPLGMVTLTYPAQWLAVAPSGRVVKRHLKAFRQRYGRAVGRRLDGAWKLEFQRRGAPHFHVLMPCPALVNGVRFEDWLSATWASIVKADDTTCDRCGTLNLCTDSQGRRSCSTEFTRHRNAGTGLDFDPTARSTDPKRLGVYFMKHGTKTQDDKEYQHWVPRAWLADEHGEVTPENGPGRFWGMWGLPPATVEVELDAEDFVTARRVLRKVAAARARAIAYRRARAQGASVTAAVGLRRGRSRVLTGSRMVGGFVVVNDGVRLGEDLARALVLDRLGTLPSARIPSRG